MKEKIGAGSNGGAKGMAGEYVQLELDWETEREEIVEGILISLGRPGGGTTLGVRMKLAGLLGDLPVLGQRNDLMIRIYVDRNRDKIVAWLTEDFDTSLQVIERLLDRLTFELSLPRLRTAH